jgi:hypothetical protein
LIVARCQRALSRGACSFLPLAIRALDMAQNGDICVWIVNALSVDA